MPAEPEVDVQVAPSVLEKLEQLAEQNPQQADSVARAITSDVDRIGADGERIRIDVPKGPKGAKYYAVTPAHPDAPAVVYRALTEQDGAVGWLVTALISRADYAKYRLAARAGLLDDPLVQGLIIGGLLWLAYQALKGQGTVSGMPSSFSTS